MPPSRSRERIGESRCHQYRSPAAAKRQVLEHVDVAVLERGVVERRDVPEPHRADVGDDAERRVPERPGRALDPVDPPRRGPQDLLRQRRASGRSARGRRSAGAGPCARSRAARRARSTGEISATNRQQRSPVHHSTSRPSRRGARAALGARRSASARRRSPRRPSSAMQHDRRERPRRVDRTRRERLSTTRAQDCDDHVLIRDEARCRERSSDRATSLAPSCSRSLAPPAAPACRRAARARRASCACARRARARCRGCAARCPRCGLPRAPRPRRARRRPRRSRGRGRRWPTRASRASSSAR